MNSKTIRATLLATLFCASIPSALPAQSLQAPGSVLLFPHFDHRPGKTTAITITNTNGDLQFGDVRIEIRFVNGVLGVNDVCARTFVHKRLRANDTLTLVTNFQASTYQQGYAYVTALSPATGAPIAWNHLVGSSIVFDSSAFGAFGLDAISFRAVAAQGQQTDVDADGVRDLNGVEYVGVPDELHVPRFLGQSASHVSDLVLVNLSGGSLFTSEVGILAYDDDANAFGATHSFRCWTRVPLANISGVFTQAFMAQSGNDPFESVDGREQGWFRLDGLTASSTATTIFDPATIAVLLESTGVGTADLPFGVGQQNNGGLSYGGSLFPDP